MLPDPTASALPQTCDAGEQISITALESDMKLAVVTLLLFAGTAFAAGTLTDDQRISSDSLGYDLQYRVYLPENYAAEEDLAVMFVTDGQSYIAQGKMPRVLDRLIGSQKIEPVVVVFVDARDPDNLNRNRRNAQFFCNRDYLKFYTDELIPRIEGEYPVARVSDKRGILGMSFGGLNSACFGILGHDTFADIGMHSPANHPVPGLLDVYEKLPTLPLRLFLSYGTPKDNTQANRRFRKLLQEKGYTLEYVERREGHNWDNWGPLIDDVLVYFYPAELGL
jgi:enterochelin esterase-like enzyme